MVTKDLPDYTKEVTLRYTGGFIGLEELAVRLGSGVPWDVRGNVVLFEDFSTELTEWPTAEASGSCSVARSSRHKYSGDWSLRIVVADGVASHTGATRMFKAPVEGKVAYFLRAHHEDSEGDIRIEGEIYTGSIHYVFRLRFLMSAQAFYVWVAPGSWQAIPSFLGLEEEEGYWQSIIVVVDLDTGMYVKAISDKEEYDLSAYSMEAAASAAVPIGYLALWGWPEGGTGFTAYYDDIIILENVP